MKQVWTFAWLNTFPMLSGKPLSPSQTVKNTSLTLRFFGSVRQLRPELRRFLVAVQIDTDRGVVGLVTDLPVTHL